MFLKPSDNSYDPADDLTQPGTYLATCVAVKGDIPHRKYPAQKQIAIRFALCDPTQPQYNGKYVAIVCTQSLWRQKSGDKVSALVAYLRQAGFASPENGCDPEKMVGHDYVVMVESFEGRCFVRGLRPATADDKIASASPISETLKMPPPTAATGDIPF